MTKFGLAVVGAGMAAKPHGRALADLSDKITVTGVYTRSAATREAFCAEHGFTAADDLTALADDPATEGLLLLTPPDHRADPIRLFAERGKPVLTEKPLGRTLAEAESCAKICADAGVALGIVFQHRYRAASQALAERMASGDLGALQMVRADIPWWRDQGYYDTPGRGTIERDGGGVLVTQAIHSLDLMLSLTGPVTEVQAFAATTALHRMECEDFVAGGMRFANGAVGSVYATTAAYPGDAESLRLDCEKAVAVLQSGTLTVHWRDGRTETVGETATTGGGADPMAFPHEWHMDLISAFVDSVRAGSRPVPSGEDAVAVQRLIDALLQSSAMGTRVSL